MLPSSRLGTNNTHTRAHAACFFRSRAACLRLKLHSSYARPAPNPTPTKAGHALRLNSRTEKTTPNPRPRVDLTRRLERQWSHYKGDLCQRKIVLRAAGQMSRADAIGSVYLLVEERFAHRPGNGAGLRAGDGGFGHCGCSAAHHVSSYAFTRRGGSSSTYLLDSIGASGSNNRAAMSFEGSWVRSRCTRISRRNAVNWSQPVPKAVRGPWLDRDELLWQNSRNFGAGAGKSRGATPLIASSIDPQA